MATSKAEHDAQDNEPSEQELAEAISNPAPMVLAPAAHPLQEAPRGLDRVNAQADHRNQLKRTKDALAAQVEAGETEVVYIPTGHPVCRGKDDFVYVTLNGLQVPVPIAERVTVPSAIAEILNRALDGTDAFLTREKKMAEQFARASAGR